MRRCNAFALARGGAGRGEWVRAPRPAGKDENGAGALAWRAR